MVFWLPVCTYCSFYPQDSKQDKNILKSTLRAALAGPLFTLMLAVTLQAGSVWFWNASGGETVTYAGGSPLARIDIPISEVFVSDQFGNLMIDAFCTGCLLQFMTGGFPGPYDDPPNSVFVFAGGGFFSVTGSIPGSSNSLLAQGGFQNIPTGLPYPPEFGAGAELDPTCS